MSLGEEILVSIRCCAYNHEPYIRKCLEGFVMQKTTFRFQAVVHDDASTDGTAAVIREFADKYPDIIKPIYSIENQYSKRDGSLSRILNEHMHGKYIAICEGDDYWTDPYKLQKQVEALEVNPQYSMCSTACMRMLQETGEESVFFSPQPKVYSWKELIRKNKVVTATTLLRKEYFDEYNREVRPTMPKFPMGDYPMWLFMASKGPIIQLEDNTATYRVLASSASHFSDPYKGIEFEIAAKNVSIWANHKFGFGKRGLGFRKFNAIRIECRRVARKTGSNRLRLFLWSLRYMISHPAPRQ